MSSYGDDLYLHSAHPTHAHDAVFFGPDSYRFARLIADELRGFTPDARILDIGTGTGIGAIVAKRCLPGATLTATDINPLALAYARVNAEVAGLELATFLSPDLECIEEDADIVLANPPYITDPLKRAYRDGGGAHGTEVALRMAAMAVERLKPHGKFVLYSGSAIVDGHDRFEQALAGLANKAGCKLRYRELDPDVFGEELVNEAYRDVERIAVVAAVLERDV
ncbi:MAG: class I SAM-dependent methyltransferase [Clostridia bacterium]|nr:class I SAM-dependent methyltransferase [Deltaproteobacteria bacterium]